MWIVSGGTCTRRVLWWFCVGVFLIKSQAPVLPLVVVDATIAVGDLPLPMPLVALPLAFVGVAIGLG